MEEALSGRFIAVTVKPEHRQAFFEASVLMAQNVVSEDAQVFQFQIMADAADPNRFYFYNMFGDDAAEQGHRDGETFRAWLKTVQPMLAGEIETLAEMRSLFPSRKGFAAQKPGLLIW